jgi:hypothetical protein
LTYLSTARNSKEKILAAYPGLSRYLQALESLIVSSPEAGRNSPLLTKGGKTLLCKEKSVSLDFFQAWHAIGYSRLTGAYIFNDESIAIVNLYFS